MIQKIVGLVCVVCCEMHEPIDAVGHKMQKCNGMKCICCVCKIVILIPDFALSPTVDVR